MRLAVVLALSALMMSCLAGVAPHRAAAQLFEPPAVVGSDAKLFLEADELIYDAERDDVVARGNVFIAYRGYQLFASEVGYDRSQNLLTARGGVRLEEPGGNIVVARELTLSDDFRDGFLTGLRVDTINRTRLAANRAERQAGSITVFEDAAYTACYSCRRRPDRPPTWAIRARQVIYNEEARTLRFEEPRFDLFGATIGPLPSFTIPDPTVRRKSGFLTPTAVASNLLGVGVRVPYFQTLGPSRDVTLALTPLSRQGLFADATYRERLINGAYEVRLAGIRQADPDAFDDTTGDRRWRGSVSARGNFFINPRWQYGFETTATTDREFLDDYKQSTPDDLTAPTAVYLTGLGARNHFDARLWAFRILQEDYDSREVLDAPPPFSPVGEQLQGKQAFVHPVIDYEGVYDGAVLSGELAYRFNLTSLSRQETDAFGARVDGERVARFRGVEGTFTRASAELGWRARHFAPLGQVLTPFAGVRADVFAVDGRDPNADLLTDDPVLGRFMPYAGLSYRWPWLVTAAWGTQTIEPIAEIVARPSEPFIADLPNEDAQSVVFDDTNLFGPTKFSGYDRVEGGVRANVGLRYAVQTYSGGFLSATFGQSYQLAGRNSYRVPDILDAAGASGLASDRSDFVGALYLDTNGGLAVTAKGRFDDETFAVKRAEVSAAARTGPLSSRLVYAFLDAQPDLGLIDEREEVQGSASLRVFDRLRVFGQLRLDLDDRDIINEGVGIAYDDDALSASLAYSEDRGGLPDDPVDRTVFLRIGLRTIGDATVSTGLDN